MLSRLVLGKGVSMTSKTPTSVVVICSTVVVCLILGCLTILAYFGKDATEIRSLINTLLNVAALILSGGSFIAAGVAAKRSNDAAENTNGQNNTSMSER